jgi:ABC-type glycerol-3-phosphate transport system substrate-binding protein
MKILAGRSHYRSLSGLLVLAIVLFSAACGKKPAAGSQKPRHSVTLSWTASTSPVVGYSIYRASTPGGRYTKLNSKPVVGIQYQDTSVEAGQTYSYYVTAVNAINVESRASDAVIATVPTPLPSRSE